MKRLIAGVVVLAILAAAVIAALPFLVSSENVRNQIIAKVAAVTGRQMSFRDAPTVFLNPYLGIEVGGVIFEGPREFPDDPPLVQMEKLRGRIAILPALFGRIEIYQYQFIRPRFNLKVFHDGRASWQFPEGRVWEVLGQAREKRQATEANASADLSAIPRVSLGDFEVVDGIIDYESTVTGSREIITNVNAAIRWPDTASAWAIRGRSIWRDEAMEFAVRSNQPLLLLAGGTSASVVELNSGALRFSFDGDANLLAGLHLAGNATIASPSIPRVVNFFGGRIELGATPGAFQISGKLNGTPKQLQLSEASLTIDGNQGRGVVQITMAEGGRPQINATLAFQSLDLSPYLASLRQEVRIGSADRPGLRLLDRFDCDLRLSSAKATLGTVSATDFGAALSLRNSELLFDLGSATVFGGNATGKFSLKKKDGVPHLVSETHLSNIQLAGALATLPKGAIGLDGAANITIEAKSSGQSVRELVGQLRGWATLEGGAGKLTGASIVRIRANLASGGEGAVKLGGESAYGSIKGDMIFDQGTVWIRSLEVSGSDTDARFFGRGDLASGGLALRGRLSDAGPGGRPDAMLVIGGSIDAPLVSRDAEADNNSLTVDQ